MVGRRIVGVEDSDTYVSRPHAPGEIADALTGRRLTAVHRRGKFIWAETDGDGPELGLHLGMAGHISIDEEPHPRWDRFVLEFEGGGRLALRDRRRLGRAVVMPDFSHVGPDAEEVRARSSASASGGAARRSRRGSSTRRRSPASGTCWPTRSCGGRGCIRAGAPASSRPKSWTSCAGSHGG